MLELTGAEARSLIAAAVCIAGRVPHAILLELFTEGAAGTLIRGG